MSMSDNTPSCFTSQRAEIEPLLNASVAKEALNSLYDNFLARVLVTYGRMDTCLYYLTRGSEWSLTGKCNQWFTLNASKAIKRHVTKGMLWTFLRTDLALDPSVSELLNKCGCGHLLQWGRECFGEDVVKGFASDVRKYFAWNRSVS